MKSLASLVLLFLFNILIIQARPAYPGILYATMEDGSRIAFRIVGDEHQHAFQTLDGKFIERVSEFDSNMSAIDDLWRYVDAPAFFKEEPDEMCDESEEKNGPRYAPAENRYTSFPTLGEMHGLVLLVEYQDVSFQPEYDQALYERQLNEPGYREYDATGSARDYFIDQSMGQFVPTFDAIGPIKLPNKRSYYGQNRFGYDYRAGEMIRDACVIAHDSLGINFANYDYNDDGEVDFVFCIYAGYGENYGASANTVWPHMSWLSEMRVECVLDEKKVELYACSCELNGRTGHEIDGIGALCHEFGHVMGLPDLYNTTNQSKVQLGDWDIMDSGSYNNDSRTPPSYTSFERHQLGWLNFIDLTEPADSIVVPEYTQSNVAYRIFTNADEDEFFTLENHQMVGWDEWSPGSGLMIIHVDYSASTWEKNTVNSGRNHKYDLMEADGTQGRHPETDLYPSAGNTMFTDYSTPNSQSWSGIPTDRPVTHIAQNEDGTVSFRFMHDDNPTTGIRTLNTNATDAVFDLLGRNVVKIQNSEAKGLYVSGNKRVIIRL